MDRNPCSIGALRRVFESDKPTFEVAPNPILQVLQVKPIAAQKDAPARYRVVFSDTQNFIQSMLATQTNPLVVSGDLCKGCFVRLRNYQANSIKNKRILIVLGLEVLKEHGTREKIGEPVSLEAEMGRAEQPQASATTFYGDKPAPAAAAQRGVAPGRGGPTAGGAPGAGAAGRGGLGRGAPGGHSGGGLPTPRSRPSNAIATTAPAPTTTPSGIPIFPIESLSPFQSKWAIRARVTYRSEIKYWQKQQSQGKLFTVHFLDDSGEIRATGFGDQVDILYEVLQEDQVFFVSGCSIRMANKKFTSISHDYELALDRGTEVEKCNDAGSSLPQLRFNFVKISDLENVEKDAQIDLIGVIKEVGDVSDIQSKTTQKSYSKREITLADKSGYSVRMTVWGNSAQNWEAPVEEIVAFKGVKVSDFGGRTLSMQHSSTMTVNPDIDEAHMLRGWYDGQGRAERFKTHQGLGGPGGQVDTFKNLAQVKEQNLGMGDKPDYFTSKATIVYIRQENVSYPACLTDGCNKKVILLDGGWNCERCDKAHPKPQHRYVMTISCVDAFGQAWLSCFDESGRVVMGMSADELFELQEQDDEKPFAEANGKSYIFRCRAKMDVYQDQQRVRYQVMSASPLNYAAEAAKLIEQIKLYS